MDLLLGWKLSVGGGGGGGGSVGVWGGGGCLVGCLKYKNKPCAHYFSTTGTFSE